MRYVLDNLKKIRKEGIPNKELGICFYTKCKTINEITKVRSIYESWPHFSGDLGYPVPHELGSDYAFSFTENKWDRRTKYGRLRWDLLDYTINYLERELSCSK